MISILIAVAVSFIIAIFGTPIAIRTLRQHNIGQFIQQEVEGHYHKRGTPTMGGVVIILAVVVGYLVAHLRGGSGGQDPICGLLASMVRDGWPSWPSSAWV